MTEVPNGWRLSTVDQVGRVGLGRQRHPDWHNGPEMRPYLRVANVFEDRIDARDIKEMDFSGCFERFRLEPGDVLLNEGQTPELLGRPAIYRGNPPDVAFTNTLIRFQAGAEVLPEWALIVFRRHMHFGRFTRESRITTNIAHLSAARFKTVEFPVPPLDEQRRIVDILEDHLSRLDAAESGMVASVARLVSLKERVLAAGLLGESMPGPRAPSDLVDCGTDDGQLSDLPVGWIWRRLGEVATVAGGVTKDSKRQSDPAFVEVPYLRVANVQRGRLDLSRVTSIRVPASKAEALRLLPGDVLMNEGGDRDKLARGWVWEGQVEDCIHQNHVFRARVLDAAIEPKLLSWAANTMGGRWADRNGKQSVNLASISLTKIRQMPVPVPPKDIQPELVKQLEGRLEACDRLVATLNEASARAATLRWALLAAAYSGRLTGRSLDMEMVEEMADV